MTRIRKWLPPALLVVALIGAWQIATTTGAISSALNLERFLVPSPAEVASSLWDNRSLLAENAWVTLQEMVLGFCCALIAGAGLAVAMHLSATLRRAFYPLLIASQAVPTLVLAPVLVVWLGYGSGPKVVIVALVCFFPITVNAFDGLRSVNPEATKLMRSLDASRWQRFLRVEAPTALPYAFSGMKIAAAVAAIGAFFGEWVGSSSGLGRLMLFDQSQLETARMYASVVVMSVMAIGFFGLIALAERRVVTWR